MATTPRRPGEPLRSHVVVHAHVTATCAPLQDWQGFDEYMLLSCVCAPASAKYRPAVLKSGWQMQFSACMHSSPMHSCPEIAVPAAGGTPPRSMAPRRRSPPRCAWAATSARCAWTPTASCPWAQMACRSRVRQPVCMSPSAMNFLLGYLRLACCWPALGPYCARVRTDG